MIETVTYSTIETEIFQLISEGKNKFEDIIESSESNEEKIQRTLASLIARELLIYNTHTKVYSFPVHKENQETVILEGNILLPTTVIRVPKDNCMYVCRGTWYKFPLDFDVKRIIWNVQFQGTNKSTLIDMIRTSVLKEKKSKIVHNPEYDNLRNKIVPYSDDIKLKLNSISDDVCDVTIQFKININPTDALSAIHTGFTVRSEISTKELFDELEKKPEERDYSNIKLNSIYTYNDFMVSKNDIPVSIEQTKTGAYELTYMKITLMRNVFEFTYYTVNSITGMHKKVDVETIQTAAEAINRFKEIFSGYAMQLLNKVNFVIDEN